MVTHPLRLGIPAYDLTEVVCQKVGYACCNNVNYKVCNWLIIRTGNHVVCNTFMAHNMTSVMAGYYFEINANIQEKTKKNLVLFIMVIL